MLIKFLIAYVLVGMAIAFNTTEAERGDILPIILFWPFVLFTLMTEGD